MKTVLVLAVLICAAFAGQIQHSSFRQTQWCALLELTVLCFSLQLQQKTKKRLKVSIDGLCFNADSQTCVYLTVISMWFIHRSSSGGSRGTHGRSIWLVSYSSSMEWIEQGRFLSLIHREGLELLVNSLALSCFDKSICSWFERGNNSRWILPDQDSCAGFEPKGRFW